MARPTIHLASRRNAPHAVTALAAALAAGALLPGAAGARTYVAPHVMEVSGKINSMPYTFDTTIFATYVPGQAGPTPGGGATVDVYLYDPVGGPMTNNGVAVCAPCSYALDATTRKQNIRVEDLILAHGPFDSPLKAGFAVINVGGSDADGVSLQALIVNSHSSPLDLETTPIGPQPLGNLCDGDVPGGSLSRVHVIPHVLDTTGKINSVPFTFDTTIFATYVGGLAGVPAGPLGGASVDLYLYDDEGHPMTAGGGLFVCAPCTYALNGLDRRLEITLEDEFLAHGGMPLTAVEGYAVVVVTGEPDAVNLQGLVVNSHDGASDLAMSVLEPRSIPENSVIAVPPAGPALDGAMRVTPNPARAGAALGFTLARAMEVELAIYDVGGRKVAQVWSGRREAGAQALAWNGRIEGGQAAPAGVYFARLTGEGVTLQNRVVALR